MLGNCYLPQIFGVRILEFLSNCHLIGYDRVSIAGYPCPACRKRGGTAARRSPGPGRRGASRANSTKIPCPRKNPAQRPTDPGRPGKEGPKGGIKKEPNAQALCRKNLDFFPDDRQTPARREARNHRGEDAEMLGPLPSGPQHTGRAD